MTFQILCSKEKYFLFFSHVVKMKMNIQTFGEQEIINYPFLPGTGLLLLPTGLSERASEVVKPICFHPPKQLEVQTHNK